MGSLRCCVQSIVELLLALAVENFALLDLSDMQSSICEEPPTLGEVSLVNFTQQSGVDSTVTPPCFSLSPASRERSRPAKTKPGP